MRVRRATVDDAGAVAAVHVRSWQVGYRGQLPDDLLDSLEAGQRVPRWTATLEATSWPARGVLVAEDPSGQPAGFASLSPSRDGDQDSATTGEITSFYVAPRTWRHGVGRRLMRSALGELGAHYRRASLWVLSTNAPAIGFYEATGWRADGAVKDDVLAGVPIRDLRYVRDLAREDAGPPAHIDPRAR
ncbi:GNAT family N-acetyltransferase [Pseudonocardia nematodicida]|uniref:GNAT family N-acetyltransferase n=1 Tax=Pseudonocardia nematodicida TaxID=1206997 RepID=A0ABV1KJQ1_9PSEU